MAIRAISAMTAATAQANGLTVPDITNPEYERAEIAARALPR